MKFFDPCRAQYLLAPVMYDMITFKKMQWLSLVHTEQELRKPGVRLNCSLNHITSVRRGISMDGYNSQPYPPRNWCANIPKNDMQIVNFEKLNSSLHS